MADDRERRRYERFTVKDNAYVAVRPEFYKLGKIKDISRGGVSFEYIQHNHLNNRFSISNRIVEPEIDIFLSTKKFYLSSIPCKIIYDKKLTNDEDVMATGCQDKCCGLQFGNLSTKQSEQLLFFLNNHAMSVE